MLGKIPATRLALIEKIVAHIAPRSTLGNKRYLSEFLRAYYRGVAEEDLRMRAPEVLAAAALEHLALGKRRPASQPLVKIVPARPGSSKLAAHRALVRIVTDDMPFLVDSLGIVFNQMNIAVHLIVHPVLNVIRDARGSLREISDERRAAATESWQMLEIDRPGDAARNAELLGRIEATLADVRAAVRDFKTMRARVQSVAANLDSARTAIAADEVAEARALLLWMEEQHFVFLGYRYYKLRRGAGHDVLQRDTASGLGILRGRISSERVSAPNVLRGKLRQQAREATLLVLTKANSVATVHRASYLDYVGVKSFDARGRVTGEHRFLGLWTSSVYHRTPSEVPLLRRKVDAVVEHFGLPAGSHDAKAVVNVIETFPRDELFQMTVGDLVRIVRGVVNLYERHQVRLFVRRDAYERFYSCLVYVPRDRYNTEVRNRIERIVRERFAGTHVETQVQISESTLARLHLLVRTAPGARAVQDFAPIEAAIAASAATWDDGLRAALVEARDEPAALELASRYAGAFPPAYRDDIEPQHALEDIADLEVVRQDAAALRLNLRLAAYQGKSTLHLKIIKAGEPIAISDILPMLENFGLRVTAERPYEIGHLQTSAWIQDFELQTHDAARLDLATVEPLFKEAFAATWRGAADNDGFNRLLLGAGLAAREILVLRAYGRYLPQTGIPFSQASMERTLATHAPLARQLVRLFQTQFQLGTAPARREQEAERLANSLRKSLEAVKSLDEDRILRAYLTVLRATLRTNYYQTDAAGQPKSWLSFKLDPRQVPDLPLPRPKYEIFVYSPRVEGVHLRMALVARGGLRWSDRREDFRTEVLGLMKAQNVKNTLIVPAGAKGGFVPKRLPHGSREEIQREVVASYQTFIRGLLDLTDNIVDGKTVVRANLVRRDGDDPYLVVAADKGTATFSDIANAISQEYGHWLGDAFASGGSAGYDHKGMGITARGAWECVKRHFREIGIDIQSQEFTVAGIGDMSGDVFGNGMLLSPHIKLLAAFNHQHIFLDPRPDPARSLRERQRLFKLPRSSWEDYDRKLISKNGGIYSRAAKSIPLSADVQQMLGINADSATPVEVMRAIIRMPVDLLWNGGIGTYVKASSESSAEVGDRANDAIRANGKDLRCKVIGEGGNLGCTQRGRADFAQLGGRLNTDFIDNSAGVNTSDVEVNIKILLTQIMRKGRLKLAARNSLLAKMTAEVAALVLRNNYLQSQALSVLEQGAVERLSEYQTLIRALERSGDLNRTIEFLPTDDELLERRKRGAGLTRPELAVVLSYSKIWLSEHLLQSDLPDDPYFATELQRYFPAPVRARFERDIPNHRLRREIVTTATTNSLVNRMGPVFVVRAQEDTDADPAQIARAYTIAREVFAMRELWADIEGLDNQVAASLQYSMLYRTSRLLRHATYWLLRERRRALEVATTVGELRAGIAALMQTIETTAGTNANTRFSAELAELIAGGVPEALAQRVARLPLLEPALDIVALAGMRRAAVSEVARIYGELGTRIGLDWLHTQIDKLKVEGPWQATARTGLRDSARRAHRELALRILKGPERGASGERVERWCKAQGEALATWTRTLTDMRSLGSADFATLTVGVNAVRSLTNN